MIRGVTEVKRRLTQQAGLDPDLLDRAWFEQILEDRFRELGLQDGHEYCEMLRRDSSELQRLVEHVSVSETWFFRYPESFQLLVRHLQELRVGDSCPPRLRMLSVACATGEEPYSMAIAALRAGWTAEQILLDAVDRNAQDIRFARLAKYGRRRLRDDAPDWANRWFHDDGRHLHVAPAVTGVVNWIVADILQAPSAAFQSQYDIVFCRNLLIYLHEAARRQLTQRLADWLTGAGLLFVGHAERTEAMRSRFQFATTPHAFALRALPRPSIAESAARLPDRRSEQARENSPDPRERNQPTRPTIIFDAGERAAAVPAPAASTRSAPPLDQKRGLGTPDTTQGEARDNKPTPLAVELNRARELADAGRLQEALRAVETIIDSCEPDASAYSLLGSVHLAMGQLDSARAVFLKSIYLSPRCEDSLLQLALVYDRQGNQRLASRYRARAAGVHRDAAREES